MVDETSSTSAVGQGFGSIEDDKPTTAKLPFYTGDMVDKSDTGFTGLLNQGATCYLNSMIQSLYMTPELREAIFEWRYDPERDPEEKRCIPLQLQKLFASLQISIRGAVRTRELTTSFGWTGREVYQQHDVLELSNVLFENLETQTIGTKLSMVVSDLHRGSYKDYVQCLNCKSLRGRNVPFVGLGLDIDKAESFEQAMRQYITPEILDGGNQVTCDKCASKQDSKKGIRLTSLPYFFGIHLKRWTFNFATLMRIKIQKQIPFPRTFNGADYLNHDGTEKVDEDYAEADSEQKDQQDKPLEYELYSMMIHTGGATGGHYFAYIKDFESGKWLHFNDSSVKEIPSEEIEKWFNPPPEPAKKEQDDKSTAAPLPGDDKPSPAPIPAAVPSDNAAVASAEKQGGGMDIGAAIAANLKDKQQKKDAKKKLEEEKKKRPQFLHPFGAAYMLMYRLVDAKRNVIKVSEELIPENIVEEIKKDDDIYAKQKEQFDFLRQFITLKIHYDGKTTDVRVKKKESFKKALETVYEEMKLSEAGVSNVECMRLRNMKVTMNVPLQPYDVNLEDAVESFEFHDPKHLILETRAENEEFAAYEKEKISLRMVELEQKTMEWKKEVLVQVDDDAKIGALRRACAQKLGIDDVARIRMAYHNDGLALLLSDDEKRIKKDERILSGHYIHVEVCGEGGKHSEGKSLLMEKFDKQLNTLHLMYNELDFDQSKDDIYTLSLEVDVRCEVGKLREILAEKLGLSVSELVLRKGFHQQELKDDKKTLEAYKLHTNSVVFVERGTPLLPTQYLFQVFIEDEVYKKKKAQREQKKWDEYLRKEKEKEEAAAAKNDDDDSKTPSMKPKTIKSGLPDESLGEAFLFVGDCVLDEQWTMERVKREIVSKVANVPPANQMRLRSFNDHNRLMKVYFDNKTLKGNLKKAIKDYTQICCQQTATENEEFSEDKILLYVAQWFPQRMDFGPTVEYAFNKKTKIKSELREELSKYSGIPVEHLRCDHPRAYYLQNPEHRRKICILDWENESCGEHTVLTSKQWKCKNGEFILFKDNREKEKLSKEDFETASISSLAQREENPLVFYTPQQQIEREIEQKKKEEEEKQMREQAQQDAIARMKQSHDVAAKAAQKSMQKSLQHEKQKELEK